MYHPDVAGPASCEDALRNFRQGVVKFRKTRFSSLPVNVGTAMLLGLRFGGMLASFLPS